MNTIRFFLLLSFVHLTGILAIANPLTEGNIAFEKAEYQTAAEHYKLAASQGVKSFELFYNLGTTYAKLNELGDARLNLEKALLIQPGNKAARENIKWIKTELSESIAPLPEFLPKVYWNATSAQLNINSWYFLSFILLLLAAFLLWQRLFNEDSRFAGRRYLVILTVFLISSMLALSLGNSRASQLSNKDYRVIMSAEQALLIEPEANAETILMLSVGSKVEVESALGDWLKVTAEDGAKGWITNNGLAIIVL